MAKSTEELAMKNRNVTFTVILLALISLGLPSAPKSFGVLPPPDGAYPNFNTAEGQNALFSLTAGVANTAVGWFSLFHNTDGIFNTGVGAGTLLFNVGNQNTSEGIQNTAIGTAALLNNTSGTSNCANGAFALFSNTTGDGNTANGAFALQNNMTGGSNTAVGLGALLFNTEGNFNTAIGDNALVFNTTGSANSANGAFALHDNTIGDSNTAVGFEALFNNTQGSANTAIGSGALQGNEAVNFNVAVGSEALHLNATGDRCTAIGTRALRNQALGTANIALGVDAGSNLTNGDDNIYIGSIGPASPGIESNTIRIGKGFEQRTFIAGINGATIGAGSAVQIDAHGQLGTILSSRRFKKEIKPMGEASEAIFVLKPVAFQYKTDNTDTPQFGLIAEEVAEVNPDLIVRNQSGEPLTVRYDAVNAMLLNEFLREHKKVEEQAREIREQKAAINRLGEKVETVIARIGEHGFKTKRMNEQTETNRFAERRMRRGGPMPNIASNDQ
jgi:trimeric autotransporter adhesin